MGKMLQAGIGKKKIYCLLSKKKLPLLLDGLRIEDGPTFATVTVKQVDGDMSANRRKGKLIFLYDLTLILNWEGETSTTAGLVRAKGTLDVSEIDQDDDKYQVSVKTENEEKSHTPIRELLRLKSGQKIKEIIHLLVAEIKSSLNPEGSDQNETPVAAPQKVQLTAPIPTQTPVAQSTPPSAKGTKTFKQTVVFNTVPQALYETFTDERRVSAFTGGQCKIGSTDGSAFSMFGDSVVGTQVTLEKDKKIVQKWRFQTWPVGHFSTVTWDFVAVGDKTQLTLTQTGIPESDFDRTKQGWEEFFWKRVRGLFGWTYKLS